MANKEGTLGSDAIRLTASKVITMVISLVSAMLLSRFRTLEEYGTYSQIIMVINLATSIFMLGLPNSINYFLARAENIEERSSFLSVYYSLSTILSIILGFFLVSITPMIIAYFDNNAISIFWYVFAFYPWARVIMSSIENVLIVYKKSSSILIYRASNSILLLLAILIVQILDLSFNIYMVLFVVIEVFYALIVYIIINRLTERFTFSLNKKICRDILVFSVPMGLSTIVGTLNIELGKLMVGNFLTTEQLAIYTNASKEMPVTIIATSLTAVLLPHLTLLLKKKNTKKAIEVWGNSITLSYIFISFFVSVLFIYAEDIMIILYSEKYLPGVSVFRIFSIGLLFRVTYFGIILNAKGKTKFIFYSSIASLILNASLNYLLFFTFGIEGPAVSSVFSQIIINIVQLYFTSKFIDISMSRIFPWKNLFDVTLINVILGLIFYIIKRLSLLSINSIIESILLGIIWGIIYLYISRKRIVVEWKKLNGEDN